MGLAIVATRNQETAEMKLTSQPSRTKSSAAETDSGNSRRKGEMLSPGSRHRWGLTVVVKAACGLVMATCCGCDPDESGPTVDDVGVDAGNPPDEEVTVELVSAECRLIFAYVCDDIPRRECQYYQTVVTANISGPVDTGVGLTVSSGCGWTEMQEGPNGPVRIPIPWESLPWLHSPDWTVDPLGFWMRNADDPEGTSLRASNGHCYADPVDNVTDRTMTISYQLFDRPYGSWENDGPPVEIGSVTCLSSDEIEEPVPAPPDAHMYAEAP